MCFDWKLNIKKNVAKNQQSCTLPDRNVSNAHSPPPTHTQIVRKLIHHTSIIVKSIKYIKYFTSHFYES